MNNDVENMRKPVVSFVMPAYKAQFLEVAVRSIVGQSAPDWELLVVDDCSPQDLRSIVAPFEDDPRVRYFRNAENLGGRSLVRQWNHCLEMASGEWVVMAADDDIYAPDFCRTVLDLAGKYPEADLIRARVDLIGPDGQRLWGDGALPEFVSGRQFLTDWMAGRYFTCVGNFAFRRARLLDAGGFKEFPCAFCSDVATPLMLSGKGVAHSSEVLFNFRQSDVHLSGDRSRIGEKMEASLEFYEWLRGFAPDFDRKWIHEKCIYDCFNQAVKFASFRELPSFLRTCREAGVLEKMVMVGRWLKNKIMR